MPLLTEIAEFAPFRSLEPEHLAQIVATARDARYKAGERIFSESTPAWGCWIITGGHVALTTALPGQGTTTIDTLGAGDLLGWSWLVEPYRWHFTATALTDVTAIRLDTDRLKNFAETDPGLGYAVMKALFAVLLDRLQATRARTREG